MTSKKAHLFNTWASAVSYVLDSRGLKQKFIVQRTGKSYSQVSKWLSGKPEPNDNNKALIESSLGISVVKDNQNKFHIKNANNSPVPKTQSYTVEEEVNDYVSDVQRLVTSGALDGGLSQAAHLSLLRSARELIDSYIRMVESDLQRQLENQRGSDDD